jgi:uncharacterized protein (TIGR03083 family)
VWAIGDDPPGTIEAAVSEALKAQLREAHARVFDGLLDAVSDLADDAWATPTGCPGWDVHDQLAHVVGVERSMLGDEPDTVDLPLDLPHVRNDFGRTVEVAVAARRGRSPAALIEEAQETFRRRLQAIDAMPVDALSAPLDGPAGMQMKASQMLRTRLYDMTSHEHDIRRALGRPGDLAGPNVDIAVEQVLRAWARMLPARTEAPGVLEVRIPERDSVRIDLSDGQLHRGGEGPTPTATLHLDVPGLLAIAGGRSDAPPLDDVVAAGDREWAAAVLARGTITP